MAIIENLFLPLNAHVVMNTRAGDNHNQVAFALRNNMQSITAQNGKCNSTLPSTPTLDNAGVCDSTLNAVVCSPKWTSDNVLARR